MRRCSVRARLKEAGIPIPFYQAVDFRPRFRRNYGERSKSLATMGVLDALLIPAQCQEQIGASKRSADRYLFPKFQLMTVDLANWLQPAVGSNASVTPEEVDLILRSIMIDESRTSFTSRKRTVWRKRSAQRKVSAVYQSKYIGVEARRRYWKK